METEVKEMLRKLAAPFPESAVKWRAAVCGLNAKGEPFVIAVPYLDQRAGQQRLDDVVGADNWMAEYRQGVKDSTMCRLSLRINGQFISKEDGADLTDIEPIKGGISNAFRRAASAWGIGRYLYRLNQLYGNVSENGDYKGSAKDRKTGQWTNFKWSAPKLPPFAVPESNLTVLNGAKPVSDKPVVAKQNNGVKTTPMSATPIKAEISIEDVPQTLRDLFVELEISDEKAVALLARKGNNFAEVERILEEIRVGGMAVGS